MQSVATEPLPMWVKAWTARGLDAHHPTALLSAGAGAQPGIGIVELSNPVLAESGAMQFEARIADAAGRSSPWFPKAEFAGVQLLVDQPSPAGAEDRGLMIVSATGGSLAHSGGTRYTLRLAAPSALQGFTHDPLRRALSETAAAWAREWTARGFDARPPVAALTFSTAAGALPTELALIELGEPIISAASADHSERTNWARLSAESTREAESLSLQITVIGRPGDAQLPAGTVHDVQLVVGDAPLLATVGCRSNADCGGTSTCNDGNCRTRTCAEDDDCGAGEMCDIGHCLAVQACGAMDCGAAHVCDGALCRLKACATTADCAGAESCREGVCTAGTLGATAQANAAASPGALWGACGRRRT